MNFWSSTRQRTSKWLLICGLLLWLCTCSLSISFRSVDWYCLGCNQWPLGQRCSLCTSSCYQGMGHCYCLPQYFRMQWQLPAQFFPSALVVKLISFCHGTVLLPSSPALESVMMAVYKLSLEIICHTNDLYWHCSILSEFWIQYFLILWLLMVLVTLYSYFKVIEYHSNWWK